MRFKFITYGAALAQVFMAAHAVELPPDELEGLVRGGEAIVAEAIDGETALLEDGRKVRLLGVLAPAPPFDTSARDFLSDLTRARRVLLYYDGERSDRYGRLLVHMVRDDGLWVQGALLKAGLARVMTRRDNRAVADALYRAEAVARQARSGIWGDAQYAIRCAPSVHPEDETFQIVRGRVVDAADVRGVIYINFGADYRSDFTARLERTHRRRFRNSNGWVVEWEADSEKLNGSLVEVRGWVFAENGPMIDLDHPEQIRILDPETRQASLACYD